MEVRGYEAGMYGDGEDAFRTDFEIELVVESEEGGFGDAFYGHEGDVVGWGMVGGADYCFYMTGDDGREDGMNERYRDLEIGF
jgi:hypothetical protein